MRRIHLAIGLLGVIAFLLTGQVMRRHVPNIHSLSAEVRMMYVSRHIYLLGAALVNLVLGLYLKLRPPAWRRILQQTGSLLILLSAVSLLLAFFFGADAWLGGTQLAKLLRHDCPFRGCHGAPRREPRVQAELTPPAIVSKIEKFNKAGVAHW